MRLRSFAALSATLIIWLTGPLACAALSQTPTRGESVLPTIAAKTAGMERRDGLVPVVLDAAHGTAWLELPRDSTRVLLFVTMATGLGSNPVGLDRGADVSSAVAQFDRAGDRVLVVLENWNYRSSATDNAAHARTVRESFPPSTIAALPILGVDGSRVLVDASDLLFRDWADVTGAMTRAKQGTYALSRDRCTVNRALTKAFPRNTELDVALTFAIANGEPGPVPSAILPDGRAFTLRQHLSLVALPDDAYRPRTLDPRIGYFAVTFKDYAQPIQAPLEQRWIARHRLERVNPADPGSPIKNPIVYYIDRGIPEPIRTATRQGVSWWVEAFDKAGLKGAFRVEDLPDSVDPMDARYNVVQWENRNERGWSIGGSLGDPRTGEIVKAMARLDSHRARTDYNLYAGLMGADAAAADTAFVLARVRQVSAHEVGHTLGLAHNYIASTYERGSVMDYPPPRVRLDAAGHIDLSQAYAVGPGAYDVWAIRWGYGIFPPASEADSLRAIAAEGLRQRYLFLSDADARPEFGSDPRTNLWDDGATADEFFTRQIAVRRVAIAAFGERNLRSGEPVSLLQERFVPVYLMHRFAIFSLSKTIGGLEYSNAMRGDGQAPTRAIPASEQRRALALLTGALQPNELAIPPSIVELLAPRPYSYESSVELFGSRTRPVFDELGAARTLAQMIVDDILQRDRAARLVAFATRGPRELTLAETIDSLVSATWRRPVPKTASLAALQRVTQRAVADRLLALAADGDASPEVRAMAEYKIRVLRPVAQANAQRAATDEARAQWQAMGGDFGRWLDRRELPAPTPALTAPPGDPFGEQSDEP